MKRKVHISRFIYIAIFICLLVSMSIIGCGESAPSSIGGILKVADTADGSSIGYPAKMTTVYSQREVAPAVETLFRVDKTGKEVPWLAAGYTNDVASKTISILLKKGIKFHDGTDFNAQAVKWNLDQCITAKVGGTERMKSIDVIDDSTIRINLSEWDSTIVSNYLSQNIGFIVSPTAVQKNGADWAGNNPTGTGPFQFVSWQKDVKTTYKKFLGYWQKNKPYVDTVEWNVIADPLIRLMSLKRGEMGVTLVMDAKDLAALEKEGYLINRTRIGTGSAALVPDSINPNSPWSNIKVRQAAAHAIDTEAIVKAVYYGANEATSQWIYKGHWGYNPDVKGYPYNPTKAKQLLAEAGYPNGFKTKYFYITSPASDQAYTAVQGYLKAVGIDVTLDPGQAAKWFQLALTGGTWEGLMMGGVSSMTDLAGGLASRYIGGGRYYSQLSVPSDYVQAVKNAIAAPDFNTKQKYTQEAMKLMVDKYCMIINLWSGSDSAAFQKSVHASGFMETANTAMWTPEDCWVDKK